MNLSVRALTNLHLSSLAPEDFFLLLAHATGQTREYLIAHPEYEISVPIQKKFLALVKRRVHHEPIAYLTGHKEFYGLDFSVTNATLIPRPETEIMVERIIEESLKKIKMISTRSTKKILIADIGTGSGCIIISLAAHLKKDCTEKFSSFEFHAVDISSAALRIAKKNAKRHGIDADINFHSGSLIDPIKQYFSSADEIIIAANLPYLSSRIYQSCSPDVKEYEPSSALISRQHGLSHIIELLESIAFIRSSSQSIPLTFWLEISPEQESLLSAKIPAIFPDAIFAFENDLAQKCRFAHIVLT